MALKTLTIGSMARAANVNVETIRYYQRLGLLMEPLKPLGGFRIYPSETLDRIRFIKRAQKLGFSLQDIAHLLLLGDNNCEDVREQAEVKLTKIDAQIKDLMSMRKILQELVSECRSGKNDSYCPIIQSFADSN
ncbi:MAG: Hg(II)-responsive transcriptional regulator [Gallionellaceae bacterium]